MDVGDVSGSAYTWDAATAVTTAIDLWEITMPSAAIGKVGGISLTQTTDLGDAQHEVLNFQYVYGNTSGGSGGGTPNYQYTGTAYVSSPVSAIECRNTTQASGGTPSSGIVHGWNVLSPLDLWYPNGLEPILYNGTPVNAIRLLASPADSITIHSNIWIRGGSMWGSL